MPTAVFVRHIHPTAHGNHSYSVAIVKYQYEEELQRLVKFFGHPHDAWAKGLPEPYGHEYQWFGGHNFDLVAVFPTAPETLGYSKTSVSEDMTQNKFSTGDHRWVGYYDAEELLGKQYLQTEPYEDEDENLVDWCGCDCEACMDGKCGQGDCEHAYD